MTQTLWQPGLTSTGAVRPDKFLDRVGWNRSWERDLLTVETKILTVEQCRRLQRVYDAMGEDPRTHVDQQNQHVCEVQSNIRMYAIQKLAADGLEERWRNMQCDQRNEIILEAFFRTSCIGPSLEDARRWCPDMTIENIAANKGQLFLDFLDVFVTESPNESKTEPIFLPHPCINDIYINNPKLAPLQRFIQSQRCYFVSMIIWRILLALHDDDETYTTVRSDKLPGWKSAMSEIEQIYGKDVIDTVKLSSKEFKKKLEECVDICMCCQKPPSLQGPGAQLMNCATCKKAGRTTRYCSKECQKKDWKSGKHKKICGKPLFTLPHVEETPPEDVHGKIPVSDPGFKKSPTLLHQINRLKDSRNPDYVYMQPGELGDVAFTFQVVEMRLFFLIMRRRALQNGDKSAVRAMFEWLCQTIKETRPELSTNNLKLQLEREYGVNVDNVDEEPKPPTKGETEWAVNLLLAFVPPNE